LDVWRAAPCSCTKPLVQEYCENHVRKRRTKKTQFTEEHIAGVDTLLVALGISRTHGILYAVSRPVWNKEFVTHDDT
jgi:hypothetical protein